MTRLLVKSAGPCLTFQDLGREGFLSKGLSRGGAADRRALFEGAALLGARTPDLAIEMIGLGGRFQVTGGDLVIALTGAPMRAALDGTPLEWNASHKVCHGQTINIGPAMSGTYGYLSVAAEFARPVFMGARSAHLNAGIGRKIETGDSIDLSPRRADHGLVLDVADRFSGGELRVLPSPQIERFTKETVRRFGDAAFRRTPRGNRLGVELDSGQTYGAQGGLSVVSEMVIPGDIQMTGEGTPFILGPECATTGGYPRIASIIPSDFDRAMQAAPGAGVSFRFVDRAEALDALRAEALELATLSPRAKIRDPHDIGDLLSYQLIDGVFIGDSD